MHSIENTLVDLWSGNVAQFPQHHVTYASAKFIVAMSNGLEGDAFTSKTMFDIWFWPLGHELWLILARNKYDFSKEKAGVIILLKWYVCFRKSEFEGK